MATLQRYRASGKFRSTVFVRFPLALVAAVVVAWPYEQMLWLSPFVYLNFVLVLGLGAAAGATSVWIVDRDQIRNPPLAFAVMISLTTIVLAASYGWNFYRYAGLVVQQNPELDRWTVMSLGAGDWLSWRIDGGWKLRRTHYDGLWVWLIWTTEAMFVLGFGIYLVRERVHRAYCEACQRWMSRQFGALPGLGVVAAKELLDRGDLSALLAAPPGQHHGEEPQIALSRTYCATCAQDEYLTVSEVRYKRDKKGNLNEHAVVLIDNAVLPHEVRRQFSERFGRPDRAFGAPAVPEGEDGLGTEQTP